MNFKFELSDILKDKVTGFLGVVLSRTEYATGCNHYGLQNQDVDKDGKIRDWLFLDESRVEKVGHLDGVAVPKPGTSGPEPNPPQL